MTSNRQKKSFLSQAIEYDEALSPPKAGLLYSKSLFSFAAVVGENTNNDKGVTDNFSSMPSRFHPISLQPG
jgi:hypothetical protein